MAEVTKGIENRYLSSQAFGDIAVAEGARAKPERRCSMCGPSRIYVFAPRCLATSPSRSGLAKSGEALQCVQAIEDLLDRALVTRWVAWELRDEAVARGGSSRRWRVQAIEKKYPPPDAVTGGSSPIGIRIRVRARIIAQAQARAGNDLTKPAGGWTGFGFII